MAVITVWRQVANLGDETAQGVSRAADSRIVNRDQFHEMAEARDPEFRSGFSLYERTLGRRFL
jgi:hypothetical protein